MYVCLSHPSKNKWKISQFSGQILRPPRPLDLRSSYKRSTRTRDLLPPVRMYMYVYFAMFMRKHVTWLASNQIVSQMGTCVYGPSSKTASSLACCVVCCMTTCCCKIHELIMLPQAKLYPSRVGNFIFYQKMGILMSDFC